MKMLMRLLIFSTVLVPASAVRAQQALTSGATARFVTIDDYFQVRRISDPRLSADGRLVTYTVETAQLKEDKSEERIWMVSTVGGEAMALTAAGVSSSHARWSSDGKWIAFLSAREEGQTQVWLLPRRGGEPEQLTNEPQDVEDFLWAPDGKRLVLVLRDPSAEELEAAKEKRSKDAARHAQPKTRRPWVIDRL